MSQKKKVIHVKDLIIKADHVIIERRPGHRDHIFGRQREEDRRRDRSESIDRVRKHESSDEDDQRRRPFSWI